MKLNLNINIEEGIYQIILKKGDSINLSESGNFLKMILPEKWWKFEVVVLEDPFIGVPIYYPQYQPRQFTIPIGVPYYGDPALQSSGQPMFSCNNTGTSTPYLLNSGNYQIQLGNEN